MANFEIGDQVEGPSGQVYELVGREPFVRKTGEKAELLHWRSRCRQCGAPFIQKAGLTTQSLAVHCPAHRLSRKEVAALATKARKAAAARRRAERLIAG